MKKILFVILILAVAMLGCGCNQKDEQSGLVIDFVEEEPGDEVSEGGELSVYSYKPDTLCPVLSSNEANVQMLGIVYDSLVNIRDDMTAEPVLAESWSVSEDGLEWTVKLKNGVMWHSGGVLTADDVAYTVNTIKSHGEGVYSYNVSYISSIRPEGDTVRINLYEQNPNFPNLLYFPIIKNNSVSGDATAYIPDGTGAYRFEDRNEGNIYYLVRNDSWWGGKPKADCIKVKLLPDKDTALYAFSSGNIDLTATNNMNWGKFVDAAAVKSVGIKTPIYSFLGINHRNSVLNLVEVRAAISYMLDRKKITDSVMMEYASDAGAPVRGEWTVGKNQVGNYRQNIDAAQKLLTENGWKLSNNLYRKNINKKEYRLDFDILINEDNTLRENVAQIIEKNLEEFGIKINVVKLPYDEYIKHIESGSYDMFIGSYSLSPDLKFDFMLGEGNPFGFADDEMALVLENMKMVRTEEEQKNAYAEFINLFEQINPVVGLFFENNVMICSDKIKGKFAPSYYSLYNGIEQLYK